MTRRTVHHVIATAAKTAGIEFPVHPHMPHHACGYYLANNGQDTRAIQHYLGHKNISHTVRYADLAPSCQLLAQTTHDYTFTKKGGKPALEHARQGVQRVKLDTDQPSMLPAQHAGHRAHFLQQTH